LTWVARRNARLFADMLIVVGRRCSVFGGLSMPHLPLLILPPLLACRKQGYKREGEDYSKIKLSNFFETRIDIIMVFNNESYWQIVLVFNW
jgi:hypothetical protein